MSREGAKDVWIQNDWLLMFCFGGHDKIVHYDFKNVHDDVQNVESVAVVRIWNNS